MTTITLTLILICILTLFVLIRGTKQSSHGTEGYSQTGINRELHQKLHKSVGCALFLIR